MDGKFEAIEVAKTDNQISLGKEVLPDVNIHFWGISIGGFYVDAGWVMTIGVVSPRAGLDERGAIEGVKI
jgi:hypothetical protein